MKTRNTKIVILGITGSIGTQTVAIARKLGYRIVGCSYHTNHKLAKQLTRENNIPYCLCTSDSSKGNCKNYDDLLKKSKPDMVVNAIIGFAGLKATVATLNNKIDIALANKESVVTGGKFIFPLAKKNKVNIIPIDSEHTNLYRQLLAVDYGDVNQIYITCSGGKYFNKPAKELTKVSYAEATTHKNWSMGQKITIDSNTLMNKCFEVIEAYWYFKTKRINVLLDPSSIIHSAILLNNGTFSFTHSKPVMTNPIAWAISGFTTPEVEKALPTQDVLININDVKPISWAYKVMDDKTGSLAIIINAANEVAINLFKNGKITFNQIIDFIEHSTKKIKLKSIKNIDDIYKFDKFVREESIRVWNNN